MDIIATIDLEGNEIMLSDDFIVCKIGIGDCILYSRDNSCLFAEKEILQTIMRYIKDLEKKILIQKDIK